MLVKIASAAAVILVSVIVMLSILTPERDKFGNYTQPVQYWSNSAYFEANF